MHNIWKKIVFGAILILSGVGGFLVAKAQVVILDGTINSVTRDYDTQLKNVDLEGIEVKSDNDIINILVVGNDYREEKNYSASGLTDTMIIATMDLKHNTIKTTSLMRDLYVDIPGHGHAKLNAANSYGKIELLYKTIAQNFNIQLDGYVEVDFTAFVKAVDAVGGIEAELTESEVEYLNSTNYIRKKEYRNVKVGKQILNGSQALGYCRIRKKGTTITGLRDDYGRTWRQRYVIRQIFQKVKKLPMTEWLEISKRILKYVKTDLDNDAIITYITDCVSMGATDIHQLQIPIKGYYRSARGAEYSSVGSSIVMTAGDDGMFNPASNAEALHKFIFKYDGKKPFQYGEFINEE